MWEFVFQDLDPKIENSSGQWKEEDALKNNH